MLGQAGCEDCRCSGTEGTTFRKTRWTKWFQVMLMEGIEPREAMLKAYNRARHCKQSKAQETMPRRYEDWKHDKLQERLQRRGCTP